MRLTIVIDGITRMDADTGHWTTTPPAIQSLQLEADRNEHPWSMPLLGVIAQLAMHDAANNNSGEGGAAIEIESSDQGWAMHVNKHPTKPPTD